MNVTEPCVHGVSRKYNCALCSPLRIYKNYRRDAERKDLSFTLSLTSFIALVNSPCFLCGASPSGGVDRWDNRFGYSTKNARPCCTDCNWLKGDRPNRTFVAHVRRIASNTAMGVTEMKFL